MNKAIGTILAVGAVGGLASLALAWYFVGYNGATLTTAGALRATLGWPYFGPVMAKDLLTSTYDQGTLNSLTSN